MSWPIATPRLVLVPMTAELVDAELSSPARLAERLEAELPDDWPPEFHGEATLRFTRERVAGDDAAAAWWTHLFVQTDGEAPTLVGVGGYKGPPDERGDVEIGFSVVASCQRRGLGVEAAAGLCDAAFARGATRVLAQTLEDRAASLAVLRRLGFKPVAPTEAGVLAFALRSAQPISPSA